MKDALGVTVAMEMDQGGSTTMFVRGQGTNGIVSCSDIPSLQATAAASLPQCSGGPRSLFAGLFVAYTPDVYHK